MIRVVDISHHNPTPNFKKFKETDTSVIIRCGYGSDLTSQDDRNYKENINLALFNDVPTSVYIYSYATDKSMAESEAKHMLRLVEPYWGKISSTLWLDIEEDEAKNTALTVFNAFRNYIKNNSKHNWNVGIYASENYFNTTKLCNVADDVPLWIAKYGSNDGVAHTPPKLDNNKITSLWQFTSNGRQEGLQGNCDISYCYNGNLFKKGGEPVMEIDTAIKKLVDKGVIKTPDYWYNAIKCVKYLDTLLINMATSYTE